jgi:hypothetical protein
MNTHQQRGAAHVLVLVIIILIGLGILARLDINNTRTNHETPMQEDPDAMEANSGQRGNDTAGPDVVQ